MAIIFDGKSYAEKKKSLLKMGVDALRQKGVVPHLATILIGDEGASKLYVGLKKKFIEDLGCQLDIYTLTDKTAFSDIEILIKSLNDDETVQGIMVQFPLPASLSDKKEEIINLIDPNKDVDGLKDDSKFLHPTSKAVLEVLALAVFETKQDIMTVSVVGATGMVGKPLVKQLKKVGYIVHECSSDTQNLSEKTLDSDVVISATGSMNLINAEMIREDAIVIDVGSPHGDVSPDIANKASFLTPVPGGIGPVTITCLAENLVTAC